MCISVDIHTTVFSNWLLRLQREKLTIWGDGMAQWCASACSHAAWVSCASKKWLVKGDMKPWMKRMSSQNRPMTNDFWMFLLGNMEIYKWKAMTGYDPISIEGWWFGPPFFSLGVYFLTPNHWILKSLIHCRFLSWDLRILSEDHIEITYYFNFQICTNWWFGIGKFFDKGHDIVILGMYLYKRGTYSFIVCNLYFYTFAGLD